MSSLGLSKLAAAFLLLSLAVPRGLLLLLVPPLLHPGGFELQKVLAYSHECGFEEFRTESTQSIFNYLDGFLVSDSTLASPRGFEPLLSP